LAGCEGWGCRSSNDWKAGGGRLDRSDDDCAEAERAGRGRAGALKSSAGCAMERRVRVTNGIEIE
jgi:hypothetical protein